MAPVTGPRQSGKTVLCKKSFPRLLYRSLEDLDVREHAEEDPRGFLRQAERMLIDEIQRAPSLVSYIQTAVDEKDRPGRFILRKNEMFFALNDFSRGERQGA